MRNSVLAVLIVATTVACAIDARTIRAQVNGFAGNKRTIVNFSYNDFEKAAGDGFSEFKLTEPTVLRVITGQGTTRYSFTDQDYLYVDGFSYELTTKQTSGLVLNFGVSFRPTNPDNPPARVEGLENSPYYNEVRLSGGSMSLDGKNYVFTSSSTAVPEISEWAMMIIGFAGIGLALRHRRRGCLADGTCQMCGAPVIGDARSSTRCDDCDNEMAW